MISIDIEMTLASRSILYGLLQRVFSETPDAALDELEHSEVTRTAAQVYADLATRFDCRGSECFLIPERPDGFDGDRSPLSLEGEYNRLFVGVGKPAVCTWESIYATGNAALFQANTLTVRQFYERFGLQSRDYPRTADDHVAIELAFMRELAIRSIEAHENSLCQLLHAQLEFLNAHLGTWVEAFAKQVSDADKTGYYRSYALMLQAFVNTDKAVLDNLCAPSA